MRNRLLIVVAAATGLALAGTGIALASIPDSSGVIHACYQNPPPAHGANLQVIDTGAGGSCGGGMAALTWNQTGPQGPAGATGATGPQGPAGPSTAGPTGLDVIVVRGSGDLGGLSATVSCPADHPYALGGGGASGYTPLMGTGPLLNGTTPTGWYAQQEFASNSAAVSVSVICAK